MRFDQAAQSPVILDIGRERYSIGRFTFDDFTAWGAQCDAQRREEATKGMPPMMRYQALSLYPLAPLDLPELERRVLTPDGIVTICRTCLGRATITHRDGNTLPRPEPVPEERVEGLLSILKSRQREMEALTFLLASVQDDAGKQVIPETPDPTLGTEAADPLPKAPAAG